jgi:cell division control protein 6
MLGIISAIERNEGRRGGTYREYSLEMDPEMILAALEKTVDDVGIHKSVTNLVDSEATLSDFQST